MPPSLKESSKGDSEAQKTERPVVAEKVANNGSSGLAAGASVFHWEDLCYDIQIKGNERRLLDHVDGWVKPGMSTALMVCELFDIKNTQLTVSGCFWRWKNDSS